MAGWMAWSFGEEHVDWKIDGRTDRLMKNGWEGGRVGGWVKGIWIRTTHWSAYGCLSLCLLVALSFSVSVYLSLCSPQLHTVNLCLSNCLPLSACLCLCLSICFPLHMSLRLCLSITLYNSLS